MALNIKNEEVERLATQVARMAHESKTEAIKRALQDRKNRLVLSSGNANGIEQVKKYLEREVWPYIPPKLQGKKMSKREREEILGIGSEGYPER
jgi:antitoxin VapB